MQTTAPSLKRRHHDAPDTTEAFTRLRSLPTSPEHDALREDIVAAWLPMARRLAGKYRNRGAEIEDLYQVAAMGLVKAVDRYDVARGAFEAFAVPTICGELKRHFRDCLWSIHVPRRVQELRNTIRVGRNELLAGQAGEPSTDQLAAHCGLTMDEVRDGLEAIDSFRSLSLNAKNSAGGREDGQEMSLADRLGTVEPGFDTVVDREAVRHALKALPQREAAILYMRFFQDKAQTQIGAELGLSQMHICRLLARTCTQIRDQVQAAIRTAA
ncbi:SigB/SigF/SigG family RNA polymerase sigma factor [Streptomyces sp. NPDC056670]|uniref:SigB/SigF/SigG family RNA polymerase sigma factor n=1 Tax=Streptomyces sp. NPDC056670 TaxID=3345904 RepID=UPI0036AEC7EF